MTRATRTAAAVAVIIAIAATAASCTPPPDDLTPRAFALTSAEVVFAAGNGYPVNLIFLARDDDPIWKDLNGVGLSESLTIRRPALEVAQGDDKDGYLLGNITFTIDAPGEGLTFESIELFLDGVPEPVSVDVGSWTLREAPPEDFATAETNAEVAAMSGCASAELPIPSSVAAVTALRSGSPDVQVEEATVTPEGDALAITLSCTDQSDFQVISPQLDYTDAQGTGRSIRLAPIAIGFSDIDDADLDRIKDR